MRSILHALVMVLFRVIYRYKAIKLLESVPKKGPAIIAANHITYIDALVISAGLIRQPRFVMHSYFYRPGIRWFFRACGVIPICPKSYDPEVFERAFEIIGEALDDGDLVVIFPEGKLTDDGEIGEFRKGLGHILKRNPVPVVPVAIRGLWHTFWSKKPSIPYRRRKVEVIADKAIPAAEFELNNLRSRICNLYKAKSL